MKDMGDMNEMKLGDTMYIWATYALLNHPFAGVEPIPENEKYIISIPKLNSSDFPKDTEFIPVIVIREDNEVCTYIAITPDLKKSDKFDDEKARILEMVAKNSECI